MIVSGSVLSNEMEIIPNVNIEVLGEFQFARTDASGKFSIQALSPASQIRFSHVGYDYDTVSVYEFINNKNIMYLFPPTLPDATVTNDYKKDNTLAWILGIATTLGLGYLLTRKSKKTANVKA